VRTLELFEILVANSFDATWLLDPEGTILFAYPGQDHHAAGELVGRPVKTWLHPDDHEVLDAALAGLVEGGAGSTAEVVVRTWFGEEGYRWVEARLKNLLDHPAVGAIAANTRDVTERIEAEEARRLHSDLFEALAVNSLDALRVLDEDGIITYAQAMEGGHDAEELVGHPNRDWIHPDDVDLWHKTLAALTESGTGASAELVIRGRFPTGYRWIEARMTNLLGHPAVEGIVVNARDITERQDLERRLEHQATHDSLTGLANRVLLMDRIEHALARTARHGGEITVLFLDLDQFKVINDSSGHDIGDEVLVEVGRRLQSVVRASDTLARQGGDEFVVLLEDTDVADAHGLAERIRTELAKPIIVGELEYHVTASIGLAGATGGDSDAVSLLANADSAMYQAKGGGRNRVEIFDQVLKGQLQHRLKRRTEMRDALTRDELRVFYQPVVEMENGSLYGAEALVRWQHPREGCWLLEASSRRSRTPA
jgi:diguanylate cyclase (GGDEF)-like protein/PAS domain S-box-containing protein